MHAIASHQDAAALPMRGGSLVTTVLSRARTLGLALAIALSTLLVSQPALATDKEKKADIEKLLQATGAADMGKLMLDQLMDSLRTAMKDVPSDYWDEFKKSADLNELMAEMVPIYDKNFSHAEIKDMLAFYATPTGKKVIKMMPVVTQEAMKAGQRWGEKLGQRVMNDIQARQR